MDQDRTRELLESIHDVQRRFIEDASKHDVFELLLERLLSLTESAYGFIGEVRRGPDREPYLKTHAITNIAWNEETRAFYERHAPSGLEFSNLETLFGSVIRAGEPVIANRPAEDERAGGLPEGHPPLHSFLGLPLHLGSELLGMVGVANRDGGYDEELIRYLEPFLVTCSHLIRSHQNVSVRRETEEALVVSESSFRRLFDANIVGVMIADTRGSILRANDYFLNMVGYRREDLPFRWDEMTPPELLHLDAEAVRQLEECGVAQPWEKEYVHRDGHRVPLIVGVALLEGSREEVVGFALDISLRKRMEAEREELLERLRQSQKMEALGTVAAGIAHDFNNLLTAIRGWADYALPASVEGTLSHQALAEIALATERGVDLTRTMLSFSRKESVETRRIELGIALRDSRRMLEAMMPASIRFELEIPTAPVWIRANPTEIQQVLMNLALNARDAMPDGGVLVIQLAGEGEQVVLEVRDSGIGMDEETSQRVFDPFFTTKPRGSGTGLGLSVVHGVVSRIGGSIAVRSAPGAGTAMTVAIPACDAPEEALEQTGRRAGEAGEGDWVLLAEDDAQVRALVSLALSGAGYRPIDVADGQAALEVVRSGAHPIRVAILDVDMPKLDGLSCLRAIRGVDRELPVIVISGFHVPGVVGDDDERVCFLPKPLRLDRLLEAVDDARRGVR